ncbi:MAG: 3-dehydroquinate synthase [candidate division Zixibacteria bacterium]|nr:3-dehydroquinate synthase [candidate division Zixibacteria bacterium]
MKSKMKPFSINVGRGNKTYPVFETSLTHLSKDVSRFVKGISSLFCVVDANVFSLYKPRIDELLKKISKSHRLIVIPSGERTKSQKSLDRLVGYFLSEGIDRNSFVMAIGGGVTTDIVGFASSITLRGISWGAIPTTLLGMLDAAIGAKTGINSVYGKNLIGNLCRPKFVAVAPEFVLTQSRAQFLSGAAEAVKSYGISGDPSPVELIQILDNPTRVDPGVIRGVIFKCARMKSRVVSADEREKGEREALNFGHTIGHAIESSMNYRGITHGRAVAAGMIGAIYLSEKYSRAKKGEYAELLALAREIASSGRRIETIKDIVISALASDKKNRSGKNRFVLLKGIGKPYITVVSGKRDIDRAVEISLVALNVK